MEKEMPPPSPLPGDDVERGRRIVLQGELAELLSEKLEAFATTLRGREQTIFQGRWLTHPPKRLQELGDEVGVSRERVRQLERQLFDRLRTYIKAELGDQVAIEAPSSD
jgi:RNA polymerase sigma-32 factor